jgi:hypothetical protein
LSRPVGFFKHMHWSLHRSMNVMHSLGSDRGQEQP